jgi:IMP and pyridine-specific 5'-nucleotidase
MQAMEEYDEFSGLSRRRYVAPNFAEARTHARLSACATISRMRAALTFLRPCLHFAYTRQVRHVLNMAQVRGSAPSLRLITFDADGTLYEDGAHFERDNAMIRKIIALLQAGLHVGVVTAAGYPGEAVRFEGRLKGLLVRHSARPTEMCPCDVACALTQVCVLPVCTQAAFRTVSPELRSRFHVMGGECNYLLRCVGAPCVDAFSQNIRM